MYGNGYSIAIVLDHRSTALTEIKIGECHLSTAWEEKLASGEFGIFVHNKHVTFCGRRHITFSYSTESPCTIYSSSHLFVLRTVLETTGGPPILMSITKGSL